MDKLNHLEIIDGEKRFDNYQVFKKLNLKIESGKIIALVGPSGGGKTTLLNCIGRLESLSMGRILFNSKNIQDIRILDYFRNYIGYLFQNYALVDDETVLQNLNIVKKYSNRILVAHLKKYGLDDSYLDRKVFTLSGGEAQRVALTRLSLQNPKIILADEPTGALDNENRDLVLNSLKELAGENKIVLVATHDDEVKKYADQLIDINTFK